MRRKLLVFIFGMFLGGFALIGLSPRPDAVAATAMFQPGSWIVHLETNWNRYGGDLYSLDTPSPENCQGVCVGDARCRSFTWVRPRDPRLPGRCWIKGNVPGRSYNTCCVSGVKYIPGSTDDLQPGVDRPGGDYNTLRATSPAQCRNICQQDGRCRSFTFVSATGLCWIKNDVRPPRAGPGMTSGVTRPFDSAYGM